MYKSSTIIRIQSFDLKMLEVYAKFLREYNLKTELSCLTKTPEFVELAMPTKKKFFTILRSPHVHKKTKVQYASILYFKRFVVENINNNTIAFLMQTLPKGVHLRFFLT